MIALFNKKLKSIKETIRYSLEIQGMSRAASEMYRLGYYKEYEATIQRIRDMKS